MEICLLLRVSALAFVSLSILPYLVDGSNVYSTFHSDYPIPDFPSTRNIRTKQKFETGDEVSCNQYIHKFSNASSAFVECAALNAKPVKLCEMCPEEFIDVYEASKDIEEDHDCRDLIMNSDILRVVHTTHEFVTDLWTNGQCYKCYTDSTEEPEPPSYGDFSNNTVRFLALYNKTWECFNNHTTKNRSFDMGIDMTHPVCKDCDQFYCDLNKHYKGMGAASTICIDIVEMMNTTRHTWSKNFKCIKHKKDLAVVVSMSTVLSLLPVFFYLAAKCLSKKKVIKRGDVSRSGKSEDHNYISTFGSNRR